MHQNSLRFVDNYNLMTKQFGGWQMFLFYASMLEWIYETQKTFDTPLYFQLHGKAWLNDFSLSLSLCHVHMDVVQIIYRT